MEDFGCPPQFPAVEEEKPKEEERADPIIKDKAKGKKVKITFMLSNSKDPEIVKCEQFNLSSYAIGDHYKIDIH